MYNHRNVEKSASGQSVCVLCVRLAVTFSVNSHGRKGSPIELKLKGYVGLYGLLRRINFCGDSSTRL